jgi:hypothetical protein
MENEVAKEVRAECLSRQNINRLSFAAFELS